MRIVAASLLAIAMLLGSIRVGASSDSAADVLVLIGSNSLGTHELSAAELRRAYGGDSTVVNGQRLIPYNYPVEHPLRRRFDARVLGMSAAEAGQYWVERRIRGHGFPPRTVPSPEVMRALVVRLKGAIGYVPARYLDASVRPLAIDGKMYRDTGYLLRER